MCASACMFLRECLGGGERERENKPVTPRFDVEEETVQSILKQCPNKDAKKHHQSYMRKCLAHSNRHRDAPTNNWQPNDRNCPPDCESQELRTTKMSKYCRSI